MTLFGYLLLLRPLKYVSLAHVQLPVQSPLAVLSNKVLKYIHENIIRLVPWTQPTLYWCCIAQCNLKRGSFFGIGNRPCALLFIYTNSGGKLFTSCNPHTQSTVSCNQLANCFITMRIAELLLTCYSGFVTWECGSSLLTHASQRNKFT